MNPVALVNMPWSSIRQPSIALGILKRSLRRRRIDSDIHYLNIGLASRMNVKIYETISNILLIGDWLFSQHMYGEYGSQELKNSFSEVLKDSNGVRSLVDRPRIDFEQISKEILPGFLESCLESVDWTNYRMVGFTSVFYQHVASLLLAKELKKRYPHLKIVFGGANVEGTMGHETLRAFDWVDYVVDGEAEQSFPRLVLNILEDRFTEEIPGVSFRAKEELCLQKQRFPLIAMDRVPVPDYIDFFEQLDTAGLREKVNPPVLFESARGCWWGEKAHCTFCGLNGQAMTFRSKSPRRILREILTQSEKYKVSQLDAVDNILDVQRFKDVLPQLAAKGRDLRFFYEVKSSLTEEQVDLLKQAGVRSIQPGIESLSTDILKLMRKGVTAWQNIQLLKWCTERKMTVAWNILYGFPGETSEHYRQILNTIYSVLHLAPPQVVQRIMVQRYSPFFFDSEKLGIQDIRPSGFYKYIYPDKINLTDLAYHFNYSFEGDHSAEYIEPVARVVAHWRQMYADRKIVFECRKSDRFIELYDNRPETLEEKSKERKTFLTGLRSEVYEFCHCCRSLNEILRFVHKRNSSVQEAREILDEFVSNRQMYREGDRYLSLAVRENANKVATTTHV